MYYFADIKKYNLRIFNFSLWFQEAQDSNQKSVSGFVAIDTQHLLQKLLGGHLQNPGRKLCLPS